jgi:threonine dehydrogenase-like Zn-dependent dehydrogenase
MRQIVQHLKTGQMEVAEVPCPQVQRGQVLIATRASLISAGTERMLVEFSKANLVRKARQQPDKVKQVLDKIRADGLMPTLEAVFRKLDQPLPLGYCNAGVVLDVGDAITDLVPGDRVVSNGHHAEAVCVPRNLVAKVPQNVMDEEAAFAVLSSIALQGIRLLAPTLGEKVAVFGMGLIGLLTVQLLKASGCDVLAVDLDSQRLALAGQFGATTVDLSAGGNPITMARAWTAERGVDGVIITACAKSDDIIHQAAESCRKRGRIILVGVVGLNLRRNVFYEKELTFQVSCS